MTKSPGGHIPDFPIRVIFKGFNERIYGCCILQLAKSFSSSEPHIIVFVIQSSYDRID